MNRTQENFLKLLKNGLQNKNEFVDCTISEIEDMAKTHICIPFVYLGAKNSGLGIPENWKNFIYINAVRNQLNLSVQDDVINTLKQNNIPCTIIKGSTVSVNYREPLARTLGDVDVLVSVDNYDKAIKILCGDKYEDESSEDHKFHYRYTIKGVTVEIHKYVAEYSSEKYGEIITKTMDKALDNIILKRIDEFEFPCLSNEFQAATLLLHTQRHFYENLLPIRMLCDWAMFVSSVETDEWNNKVYPFVEKMGLGNLCDALVAVCNKYFDINCEEKVKNEIDDKTVEYIILEFLNGGVSKHKNSTSQSHGSSYSQFKAKYGGVVKPLIMVINQIAEHDYNLARKSPVFLPLFWIYIPIRYVFRLITGKRKMISFGTFNETAERKEYLIKKLNLQD